MIEYEELYKIVESKVSKKRFEHIKRVVQRAIEYASVYNVDIEETKLCALAHDIAKELPEEEAKKYYKYLDKEELESPSLQHAKIGAVMCARYGFTTDMVNAVKYHTTGREEMSTLEKIIYLADATEQKRRIGKHYVSLVKKDIDKAVLQICSITMQKLLEDNRIIHVNSLKCYNYYNILETKKEKEEKV